MDLKCKKLNCKYNKAYACTAKDINVAESLECEMFDKAQQLSEEQLQDVSKTMFTTKPKIHPYRHHKKVTITCNAKCLFNDGGKCVSNGITVGNNVATAKCYTFAKK